MSTVLFVHAHPDDESLATGILIAHHSLAGDRVHVLTCTLGEEGDIVPEDLRHLQRAAGDPAAPVRRAELLEAVARLGATSHLLGADGGDRPAFRDSGMTGAPDGQALAGWTATDPRTFAAQPVAEVAALIGAVIRRLRPDVVVTYDATGGYGHPDHVQTHRATMAALDSLPPGERPGRVLEVVTPQSWVDQDRHWLAENLDPAWSLTAASAGDEYFPSVVPDDEVDLIVHDPGAAARRLAALRAHRTQLTVHSEQVYALSNDIAARLRPSEAYRDRRYR